MKQVLKRHLFSEGSDEPGCLKAVTGQYPPFVEFNMEEKYSFGPCVDIFLIIVNEIGICYRMEAVEPSFGGRLLPNGTFTGFMGLVNSTTYDVSVMPQARTYNRNQAVDFADYITIEGNSIAYKYPTLEPDVAGFVKPFSNETWGVLFLTTFLMTIAIWVISSFSDYIIGKVKKMPEEGDVAQPTLLSNLQTSTMITIRGLLTQGLSERTSAGYFVVGTWLLMVMIANVTYRGSLKAKLIAPRVPIPFDSIDGLADYYDITPFFGLGSFLKSGTYGSGSSMAKVAGRAEESGIIPDIMNKIASGDYAFIIFRTPNLKFVQNLFIQNGKCMGTVTKDNVWPLHISLILRKKSPYRKRFNEIILRLNEAGITEKLLRDSVTKSTFCLDPGKQDTELLPLQLQDVYGILALFGGGIILSCVAFIFEMIIGRKNKN